MKAPVRTYRFTEEEADRLMDILDMLARQGNSDAEHLVKRIYDQQAFNPSDEPTLPVTPPIFFNKGLGFTIIRKNE